MASYYALNKAEVHLDLILINSGSNEKTIDHKLHSQHFYGNNVKMFIFNVEQKF